MGITAVVVDTRADVCWCVTDVNSEEYPSATLATKSPAPGSQVWHAGYGVHIPGNREDGVVDAAPNPDGQLRFRLSVSSGDSGGGICLDSNGDVLSPVCCTAAKGQSAQVWGGSPESCQRLRPYPTVSDEWIPVEIPTRTPEPMP